MAGKNTIEFLSRLWQKALEKENKIDKIKRKVDAGIMLNSLLYAIEARLLKKLHALEYERKKPKSVVLPVNRKKLFLHPEDSGFSLEIWLSRGFREPLASRTFLNVVRKDDVFYDIGANLGYYTLLASGIVKKAYAFEPNPLLIPILKRTVKANKLKNVSIFQCAIGDKTAKLPFYIAEKFNWSGFFAKKHAIKKVSVDAFTLEEVIKQRNLEEPTFLKMDVEGYEYNILKSLKGTTLLQNLRGIFLEIHSIMGEKKLGEIFRILSQAGFRIKYAISELEPEVFLLPKWLIYKKILWGRYCVLTEDELPARPDFQILQKACEIFLLKE